MTFSGTGDRAPQAWVFRDLCPGDAVTSWRPGLYGVSDIKARSPLLSFACSPCAWALGSSTVAGSSDVALPCGTAAQMCRGPGAPTVVILGPRLR